MIKRLSKGLNKIRSRSTPVRNDSDDVVTPRNGSTANGDLPSARSTSSSTVNGDLPSARSISTAREATPRDSKRHFFGLGSSRSSSDIHTPREDGAPPLSARSSSSSARGRLSARSSGEHTFRLGRSRSANPSGPDDPYLDAVEDPQAFQQLEEPAPAPVLSHTSVGDPVPRFQCEASDSDMRPLFQFAANRPVGYFTVLCLFCGQEDWIYCQRTMYQVEELWRRHGKIGQAQFLAISRNQSTAELHAFRMGLGAVLTMPMAADPNGEIFSLFASAGIPRVYLLDNFYSIVQQVLGSLTPSFVSKVTRMANEISGTYLAGFKFDSTDVRAKKLMAGPPLCPEEAEDRAFYAMAMGGPSFPKPVM